MTWYEILLAFIGSGGIGALIATIANVIQNRRKSVSEQKGSAIEQTKETVNLVDELLQKQLKWMSDRMDSGDAVRRAEMNTLSTKIEKRLDTIEAENRKQNETLRDVVEYLNGGFQKFEENKRKAVAKRRNRVAVQA